MKMRYLTVSMVAVTLLFTACGGGGGGGGGDDETPKESPVSIKNNVKNFRAVADARKFVTMSTGKNVITDGEPNSLFKVVSVDSGATASFDEPKKNGNNYGILRFESSTPGTYNVVVNVTNSAGTSADETFTFEVVSDNVANNEVRQTVLATNRASDRYISDKDTTAYNVKDKDTELMWLDNNEINDIDLSTYGTAKEKCTGDWRLPTLNELLDIIDYSKPYMSAPMLPDVFLNKEQYLWVEDKNGKNYFVNTSLGMSFVDTAGQQLSYRCVKGEKYEKNHLISTNKATGATYDYTTGLKWSRAKLVDGKAGAEAYCGEELHREDGWRLPTINELRSVVEDSIVPSSIVAMNTGGQHLTLISKTVSNDSTDDAQPMHYGLLLDWDRSEPLVYRFFDSGENAKYSATCVKEF
jgi:hypothetical protein